MTFVEELKKPMDILKGITRDGIQDTVFTAFVLSAAVFPGVLVIWVFNPALIESSPTSKLFLLSCSFMVPLTLMNTLLMMFFTDKHCKSNHERRLFGFGAGGAFTIIVVFMILTVSYLFHLSLNTALIALAVIEGLVVILQIIRTPLPGTSARS